MTTCSAPSDLGGFVAKYDAQEDRGNIVPDTSQIL
jgi:hypothetical protein